MSKVDMTDILNETVGDVSEESSQLGADYGTYVNETYYRDYGDACGRIMVRRKIKALAERTLLV